VEFELRDMRYYPSKYSKHFIDMFDADTSTLQDSFSSMLQVSRYMCAALDQGTDKPERFFLSLLQAAFPKRCQTEKQRALSITALSLPGEHGLADVESV
jgi:hypothetical protein